LPGVTAAEILALADRLYPFHALTAEDSHTIATPTGPLTFVPIPRSTGFLAGLLTVDLPTGIREGDIYQIVVRQLTDAREIVKRGAAGGNNTDVGAVAAKAGSRKAFLSQRPKYEILTWRRVLGAFQIDLRISTKRKLLVPEERQLALFRWIAGNVLPQSRWYPVMQRYIVQLAGRVTGFGGNPAGILPSPTGNVSGLPSHIGKHHHEVTGKVSGLVFDHFGDFEGFMLETQFGEMQHFRSREHRVKELLLDAMEARTWVSVLREHERDDQVRAIILRVPPHEKV
jgi:hypothetical protein